MNSKTTKFPKELQINEIKKINSNEIIVEIDKIKTIEEKIGRKI